MMGILGEPTLEKETDAKLSLFITIRVTAFVSASYFHGQSV